MPQTPPLKGGVYLPSFHTNLLIYYSRKVFPHKHIDNPGTVVFSIRVFAGGRASTHAGAPGQLTLFSLLLSLAQVAHFYNTIDRQMIPSQQALMLEAAMAFESIIKNPKAGTKTGSEVSDQACTCTLCRLATQLFEVVGS